MVGAKERSGAGGWRGGRLDVRRSLSVVIGLAELILLIEVLTVLCWGTMAGRMEIGFVEEWGRAVAVVGGSCGCCGCCCCCDGGCGGG